MILVTRDTSTVRNSERFRISLPSTDILMLLMQFQKWTALGFLQGHISPSLLVMS
jgi:hypothetical protein